MRVQKKTGKVRSGVDGDKVRRMREHDRVLVGKKELRENLEIQRMVYF